MPRSPAYLNSSLSPPLMPGGREDAPLRRLGEQVHVTLQRGAQHHAAVFLEPFLQGGRCVPEYREVESQDHVAVSVRSRLPADVGAAEERLEIAGLVAVVVALQQRQPAGLAEAPGAEEEHVALALQLVEEAGLVHVQAAFLPDALEEGPAVGDLGIVQGWRVGHDVPVRTNEKTARGPSRGQFALILKPCPLPCPPRASRTAAPHPGRFRPGRLAARMLTGLVCEDGGGLVRGRAARDHRGRRQPGPDTAGGVAVRKRSYW